MDTYDLCFKSEYLKVFAHKKSEEKKSRAARRILSRSGASN